MDIPQNQEILVNYLVGNYAELREERQQALSDIYNFICNCRACDQKPRSRQASEDRRAQIHRLQVNINQNRHSMDPDQRQQLLADINDSVILLHKEGLIYPHLADMYSEESYWYSEEMDRSARAEHGWYKAACREKALQVAREHLYLDVAYNGPDSPVVKETLDTIHNLKKSIRVRRMERRTQEPHVYGLRSRPA